MRAETAWQSALIGISYGQPVSLPSVSVLNQIPLSATPRRSRPPHSPMETRRLSYFVKIVDCGSITRAAAECGIAQPALSQQLAILEREMKAKLLFRSGQGVSPTPAGLALYRQSQIILRQVDLARHQVLQTSDKPSGPVSIGLPLSKAAVIGVPLLAALRAQNPEIRPQIAESLNGYLTELVINGRLDMAVLFRDTTSAGLLVQPLFTEEMFLVGAADSVFGEEMRLADVARLPLVLHTTSNSLRMRLNTVFAQASVAPEIVAEMDSLTAIKAAVEQKLGFTILSWSSIARDVELGLVRGVRIVEPVISRTVSLCTSDSLPMTPAGDRVHRMIQDIATGLLLSGKLRGLGPPPRPGGDRKSL